MPEPDGPMSATKRPAGMWRVTSLERVHDVDAAVIEAGDVADLDHCPSSPSTASAGRRPRRFKSKHVPADTMSRETFTMTHR